MTTGLFSEQDNLTDPIMMWSGLLSDIPAGWIICDGNNGTPNLTDKFVKNVQGQNSVPYSTGGQNSYYLSESQLPSHNHSGSTTSDGSHSHTFDYGNNAFVGSGQYNGGNRAQHFGGTFATHYTNDVNDHGHNTSLNNSGSGSSVDNKPSYYELAFITPA